MQLPGVKLLIFPCFRPIINSFKHDQVRQYAGICKSILLLLDTSQVLPNSPEYQVWGWGWNSTGQKICTIMTFTMDPVFFRPSCFACKLHYFDMSVDASDRKMFTQWMFMELLLPCQGLQVEIVYTRHEILQSWCMHVFATSQSLVFPPLNLPRQSVGPWTSWWSAPWHTGSKLHHRWVSGKKSPEPEPTAQCISRCPWEGIRGIELFENRQDSFCSMLFYSSAQLACTVQMLCATSHTNLNDKSLTLCSGQLLTRWFWRQE